MQGKKKKPEAIQKVKPVVRVLKSIFNFYYYITEEGKKEGSREGKEEREEGRDGGKMSYFIKYSHAELFIAL